MAKLPRTLLAGWSARWGRFPLYTLGARIGVYQRGVQDLQVQSRDNAKNTFAESPLAIEVTFLTQGLIPAHRMIISNPESGLVYTVHTWTGFDGMLPRISWARIYMRTPQEKEAWAETLGSSIQLS
jgi:hypothetical protein